LLYYYPPGKSFFSANLAAEFRYTLFQTKRVYLILFLLNLFVLPAFAAHQYKEKEYQDAWVRTAEGHR
jgi:hypothetical protein